MSIVASIRKQITPIHPEGYMFIAAAVVLALIFDWLLPSIGWLFWILPLFVAYFFRDPKRVTPLEALLFGASVTINAWATYLFLQSDFMRY